MRDAEEFWDKTAAKYAKSPVKDADSYEQTLERVRAHLAADDTVLEIGCGTGTTALLLADSAKHIIASDISSNMIEIADGKAKEQKVENVAFVHAQYLTIRSKRNRSTPSSRLTCCISWKTRRKP